jgi:hypothetical protein
MLTIETKFIGKIPQLLNLCEESNCLFDELQLIPPGLEAMEDEIDIMFSYKKTVSEKDHDFFKELDFNEKIQQVFKATEMKIYAICKNNLIFTAEKMPWKKKDIFWRLTSAIPLDQVRKDLTFEQQWEAERAKAEKILTDDDLSMLGIMPSLPPETSSVIISEQENNPQNLSTNTARLFNQLDINGSASNGDSSIQQDLFLLKNKMAKFVSQYPEQGAKIMCNFIQAVGLTTQALSNVQQVNGDHLKNQTM